MQNRKTLVVAVAVGLIATALMWSYLAERERVLLALSEPVRVVVATADVPRNSIVLDDMVDLREVPKQYLQPGAITDLDQVVGRRLAVGLSSGAQVLAGHLSGFAQPALSFLVPQPQRAVTVAVDDVSGLAGLVQPGDAVDVLTVFEVGAAGAPAQGQALARTLLQNITVLALGSNVGGSRLGGSVLEADSDGEGVESTSRPEPDIKNVTLLVDAVQAQRLVLAQHLGAITLVLRSSADRATPERETTVARDVTGVEAPTRRPGPTVWQEIRQQK